VQTVQCRSTCSTVFSAHCAWRSRYTRCKRGCRNASPSLCHHKRRRSGLETPCSWRRWEATPDKRHVRDSAPEGRKAEAAEVSDLHGRRSVVPTVGTGDPGTVPRDEDWKKSPVNSTPVVALGTAQTVTQPLKHIEQGSPITWSDLITPCRNFVEMR
jgi:hypothetical protein